MRLDIDTVAFHRNGTGGASFYRVEFDYREDGEPTRRLLAVIDADEVEDESPWDVRCYVIDPADPANRFRGDRLRYDLASAVRNARTAGTVVY